MNKTSILRSSPLLRVPVGVLIPLALPSAAAAQVGTVEAEQKISETEGGFGGNLDASDEFGWSSASLGDLDGDGIEDLAVGAHLDYDAGFQQGAVWILFLNANGTVKSEQKINETEGGFGGALSSNDEFGWSVCSLDDLDGDGIVDLVVGAPADNDGGTDQGAVWILFLDTDGTVKSEQLISETAGGFAGLLDAFDNFGASVASLGDLDGDGIEDLAVGARHDDDGGNSRGAVWILFLDTDGTVKSEQKISETAGGFSGSLDDNDVFGWSLSSLGDLDGDGVGELAVGAPQDDEGALWVLFLDTDGTVKSEQKVGETAGGFGGDLDSNDKFGSSLATLDDPDGDGIVDLAVGAPEDDDGGFAQGAVWILFLDSDGTVKSEQKISETAGGFGGILDVNSYFGWSVSSPGDLNGDGVDDLAVGEVHDDDGGDNQGAVWILFLEGDTTPPTLSCPPSVSVIDRKTSPPGEIVFFSVTASDDHDSAPSVVCVPPSGSFFPRGTTMVTCTATDASGNQSTCMFPVVVMPTVHQRSGL